MSVSSALSMRSLVRDYRLRHIKFRLLFLMILRGAFKLKMPKCKTLYGVGSRIRTVPVLTYTKTNKKQKKTKAHFIVVVHGQTEYVSPYYVNKYGMY